MSVGNFLFISIVLGFCFRVDFVNSQNLTCHADDLKVLNDFYSGMETKIEGWGTNYSTNCCNWVGVTCSPSSLLGLKNQPPDSARIVKIELSRKSVAGKLPDSIGSLVQLTHLNLSCNFLKDPLPMSLFHLPNLEVLDIGANGFSALPMSFNLPSLKFFDVSVNKLDGLPPIGICVNSTRIEVLNLAYNSLAGKLSVELSHCTSLKSLTLDSNRIYGGIPNELLALQKLIKLNLRDNDLSGPLNGVVGNLTSLVRLDISANAFSGPIPDVFYNSRNLGYFVANGNRFSGKIPTSLSSSSSIISLVLRNNTMEGRLDINCSAMINLVSLDLGTNHFNGPIPGNLPSCKKLRSLNLAKNNFISHVPESFKDFNSLAFLSLTNASVFNISSAFDILQHCQNLTILVLTFNFYGGELPADPTLHFPNLQVLVVANCGLTGMIPSWLRGSPKMQLLDLSWNHLGGTIPPWFGKFESLFYLDLANNSFSGNIPKEMTGMQGFILGNISHEHSTPDFPLFMKRKGPGLLYNQISKFPPTLNLSKNSLSGPIWPEFGNLKKILIFDLKMNNFSGSIPSSLSGMISLENLDLSCNNLSGTIPPSLENLNFLSSFSVAYNQLYGPIPTGGQFQTFANSSFEGNNFCDDRYLCNSVPSPKSRRVIAISIGVAVGIVFGISLVTPIVIMMLRKPSRRVGDPENEVFNADNESEGVKPGLVVLFQNHEINRGLSLDDIMKSTNDFDQANIIGCGGFGLVYRGILPDGEVVAIKRLSGECGQIDKEFQAEVETLSNAQHPNLVLLQGYCMFKNDKLLIYSFMENNSLDYWLHERSEGPSHLDWDTRLQIAQGAARGLAYLHQSCILHRDIKSSNILLDENFTAHLADFGLARLILPSDTHVTTDLVGTLGYIPPEYGQSSVATFKGDVYSFGVVLLELLTGKRPIDVCRPKGFRDLISWVLELKKDGREDEVLDPLIYEKHRDMEMIRVLEIACHCVREVPKQRPSTEELVSWLDKII